MTTQESIVSQAIYGENGRAALPLNVFMKHSKNAQVGGKKKDKDHLGVPLVLALVNVNINKPCNKEDTFSSLLHNPPNEMSSAQEPIIISYTHPRQQITEYNSDSEIFPPISDELYDSLLNTVLETPIEKIPDSDTHDQIYVKKYTRRNRT